MIFWWNKRNWDKVSEYDKHIYKYSDFIICDPDKDLDIYLAVGWPKGNILGTYAGKKGMFVRNNEDPISVRSTIQHEYIHHKYRLEWDRRYGKILGFILYWGWAGANYLGGFLGIYTHDTMPFEREAEKAEIKRQ